MKRIIIGINQVGLIYKNNEVIKVLTKGTYWIYLWEDVIVYDMKSQFITNIEKEVVMQNENLVVLLDFIDVADNEIVLVYKNNNFQNILTEGRYMFWKGINQITYKKVAISNLDIDESIDKNILQRSTFVNFIRTIKIESFEKAILFVDGKFSKILDAGSYYWWKNATVITVARTDMRQLVVEINGQEILTKDKAQLRINFNVQYKVVDILKALVENKDFEKQLYLIVQLALREKLGTMTFDELMESKDKIANTIFEITVNKASQLGVKIIDCGIKDIVLPGDVKEIMNQVLIAEKRAQANIITRREETASTRSLLNTAKLMEDNQMLYKLKEMEYVEKIADKINNITLSGSGQIVDQLKQIFVK